MNYTITDIADVDAAFIDTLKANPLHGYPVRTSRGAIKSVAWLPRAECYKAYSNGGWHSLTNELAKVFDTSLYEQREERRAARKTSHPAVSSDCFPVGTVLTCSWGCTMDIVDFYQVVSHTAKTVTVREIRKRTVSGQSISPMGGEVEPIHDDFVGSELTRRVYPATGLPDYITAKAYIKIGEYQNAYAMGDGPFDECLWD